jgi:hypothetical protein
MNAKLARKLADAVNGVIHSRNLYSNGRRYINAHVVNIAEGPFVSVEDLQNGSAKLFTNDGTFVDGYGQPVYI